MLRADDIDEAIKAGVITRAQADSLEAFAAARRQARVYAVGSEERFKLLGGFNDFFIALGVCLLGFGVSFFGTGAIFLGPLIFWGLAEYLTGRLKLVAPSIVIVGFLASFAISAGLLLGNDGAKPVVGLIAAVALVAAHYARFKLPFSLFVLAATGAALTLKALQLSLADGGLLLRWAALLEGLAIFAWAMSYDLTDRERLTRRAASSSACVMRFS